MSTRRRNAPATTWFPEVSEPIRYEGPGSKNPLAFRWYDAKSRVLGRSMESWLRFAVAYWHTFVGGGQDPFGTDPVYDRAVATRRRSL